MPGTNGGNPRNIPNFLKASKASGLRRLMLLNNLKHGKMYHYFDFVYVPGEKKWYVWFEESVDINLETGVVNESA